MGPPVAAPTHSPSSFHRHVYVWTSLVLIGCFVLGMLGLASPAWRSGSFGQGQWVDSGLIMECHHDMGVSYHSCSPFSLGSQTGWFEASRLICSMASILTFTLVVSCGYFHWVDKQRQDVHYPLAAAIITGVLATLGAAVYGVGSADSLYPEFRASLSWGWSVYISSAILMIVANSVFLVLVKYQRRKPKTRQIVPSRDGFY